MKEWFYDADPRVATTCRQGLAALEARGATLVPISIPHLHWLAIAHSMKISSEFALGFDYEYHHAFELLEPNSKVTVGIGKSFSAMEVLVAEKLRRYAFNYLTKEIFGNLNVTAIVNPTIGVLPPRMSPQSKLSGESNSQVCYLHLLKHCIQLLLACLHNHSLSHSATYLLSSPAGGAAHEVHLPRQPGGPAWLQCAGGLCPGLSFSCSWLEGRGGGGGGSWAWTAAACRPPLPGGSLGNYYLINHDYCAYDSLEHIFIVYVYILS